MWLDEGLVRLMNTATYLGPSECDTTALGCVSSLMISLGIQMAEEIWPPKDGDSTMHFKLRTAR